MEALDTRLWYVRWFFASLRIWDHFQSRTDSSSQYKDGTGLCHFIRTMIIWAPLAIVSNLIVYASAIGVLTALPMYLYRSVEYISVIVMIALIVGLFFAINFCSRQYVLWSLKYPTPPKPEKKVPKIVPKLKGPSFFEILWKYIVAIENKICPMIRFKNSAQGVQQ